MPDIKSPPRLTGKVEADLPEILEWMWAVYRDVLLQNADTRRIAAIGAVTTLPDTASLADVIAKVNEIILAARTA